MSKNTTDLRKQIHMKMLAKSDTAKDLGELTVVPLGHAVTVALALISNREKLARIDERNMIALDNYRGQTFSDSTQWEGKYERFIQNNEKRITTLRKELDGEEPTNE